MFLFIVEKRFAYRWKTFCSSMKKERGTSFLRQPKTGTNVTSKFSSSSSSFLSTFSLTPIGVLFVCSFVCLRAREEAYVKCSFASLYNTFFDTQKVQFLQHNLHTVFAHNFCTILHTFLIQFWLHFWCNLACILMQFGVLFWYFFEYQFAVEIHRFVLQKVAIIFLKTTRCLQ